MLLIFFQVVVACMQLQWAAHAACPDGDQSGLQIPLSVYEFVDDPLNPDAPGGSPPAMTIEASPITSTGEVLPAQRLLFDTGSAGLALCNTRFSSQLEDVLVPGLAPCKVYGGPGNWIFGYWGKVYKGGLDIGGVKLQNANYGVMQQQIGMPCNIKGFMGIFGAAFQPNFKVWKTAATIPDTLWAPGKVDDCATSIPGANGQTTMTPPLQQLTEELAAGGVSRVGVYWSGQLGQAGGTLFLNEAAVNNPHYVADCALRARLKQGAAGHYNIFIKSMTVGGAKFTGFPCTEDLKTFCILDTGSGTTTLPQEVLDAIGDGSGPLEIELEGPSPEQPTVKLQFDVAAMKRVLNPAIDSGGPIQESITMLGLPTWAFYYTVLSSDGTVDFVPHECHDTCGGGEGSMPQSLSDALAAQAAKTSYNLNSMVGLSMENERLPARDGTSIGVAQCIPAVVLLSLALLAVVQWRYSSMQVLTPENEALHSTTSVEADGMSSE